MIGQFQAMLTVHFTSTPHTTPYDIYF